MLGQIYNTDYPVIGWKSKHYFTCHILSKFGSNLRHFTFCNIAEPPRVKVLNGSETSYRVKNLESGKNYMITVTAGFNGGSSPPAQYQFRSFSSLTIEEANKGKCLLYCCRAFFIGSMKGKCLMHSLSWVVMSK